MRVEPMRVEPTRARGRGGVVRQDDRVPWLRLLSIDARRYGRDHAALARAISAATPDVVCIHGGPHLLRWRSKVAGIARRAGLVVVAGGRTAGANVVLSNLAVDVASVRELLFPDPSRLNPPGAALAALRLRGTDFALVSATMVGNAAVRVGQVRDLGAALDRLVPDDRPVVISAEGTDRPGTAAWQLLLQHRVAVGGRLFVDDRIGVGAADEADHGATPGGAVAVELNL
jgi:hypothetical protein